MADATSGIEYCHSIVRQHDKDRYIASLFSSKEARPHLWSLYALNYEIARIRDLVNSPPPGEIRLQWWAEAIESIYAGGRVDHPVVTPLAEAIAQGALPKAAFKNLIEARRFDLYNDPMPSLAQLEGYLGETSSAIIQLAALCLAGPDAVTAASAAGYAGVAYGIAGLLRVLPLHRVRGQCYLPRNLLEAEGLSPEDVMAGRGGPAMFRVLQNLCSIASARLAEARALRGEIPKAALPAFLPVAVLDEHLAYLSRSGLNALREITRVPQWRRQLRLWRMARKGRF
jgi:phytoene synthase